MGKKKNKDKVTTVIKATPPDSLPAEEVAYVKRELLKSIILSVVAIGAIIAVYLVLNAHIINL